MALFVLLLLVLVPDPTAATSPDYCTQPPVVGRCRARLPRYYFDSSTQTCRQFFYGGCDGNQNNFRSLKQCQATCICSLTVDAGSRTRRARCRASRRYHYDIETGSCKRFNYAGCEGNGNRFRSNRQCNAACSLSFCLEPYVTGVCRAAFTKYYYDAESSSCKEFIYGGCKGNRNRFDTIQECNRGCKRPLSGN